jgi:hypothetical protein
VRFSIGNPLAETTLFSASLICPPTTAHESSQASSTAPSSAWDTPPVTYPHERQESLFPPRSLTVVSSLRLTSIETSCNSAPARRSNSMGER